MAFRIAVSLPTTAIGGTLGPATCPRPASPPVPPSPVFRPRWPRVFPPEHAKPSFIPRTVSSYRRLSSQTFLRPDPPHDRGLKRHLSSRPPRRARVATLCPVFCLSLLWPLVRCDFFLGSHPPHARERLRKYRNLVFLVHSRPQHVTCTL